MKFQMIPALAYTDDPFLALTKQALLDAKFYQNMSALNVLVKMYIANVTQFLNLPIQSFTFIAAAQNDLSYSFNTMFLQQLHEVAQVRIVRDFFTASNTAVSNRYEIDRLIKSDPYVILFDDIITTGATIKKCVQAMEVIHYQPSLFLIAPLATAEYFKPNF